MQACQLCGAKSWGPLRRPGILSELLYDGPRDGSLVQCDNCGAVAQKALIEESVSAPRMGLAESLGAAPLSFNPLELGASLMKSFLPQKDAETRAERLLRAFITANPRTGSSQSTDEYIFWAMYCVRKFEAELDTDEVKITLKPRSFQNDFLIPVLNGVEHVIDPLTLHTRIGLALDCAVAFGALEAQDGNESLQLSQTLEDAYWTKVQQLRDMVY